jgi:class 3 adenylate cyclase
MFTDIEGSTRLASGLGAERYRVVLHRHRALVREVLRETGGTEIDTEGDSFFVAFHHAADACAAAIGIQTALRAAAWPDHGPGTGSLRPRVRIGLHTGEAWPSAGGYATPEVHRTARICSAAHGDQIIASAACAAAAGLPPAAVHRLGDFALRGLPDATELVQLTAPGLPSAFPPPPVRPLTHHLPADLKTPVDRPGEYRELDRAFANHRLVSLTGLGGCGKTTLAKAWARRRLAFYEHGVWYCRGADDLGAALLEALGRRPEVFTPPLDTAVDRLREARALLVLDDIDRSHAGEVERLLRECPDLQILAVGLRPLELPGEAKRALGLPPAEVGAAILAGYCEERGAPWTPADCRGLAAAVEGFVPALAALAEVTALGSPAVALRRLGEDPVRALDAGGRFRASIDEAVALISGPARAVLLELAARSGGSTVDEMLDLCRQRDGSLEALVELVDAALVVIERPAMDQALYRVPAPLRWLLVGADVQQAGVMEPGLMEAGIREAQPSPLAERLQPRSAAAASLADRLVHPVNIEATRLRAVA